MSKNSKTQTIKLHPRAFTIELSGIQMAILHKALRFALLDNQLSRTARAELELMVGMSDQTKPESGGPVEGVLNSWFS